MTSEKHGIHGRGVRVDSVAAGSPAAKRGICSGDVLVSIDGHPVTDMLDYHFYMNTERVSCVFGRNGRLIVCALPGGDPGLLFSSDLMDERRSCRNSCIFCFIDQLPSDMREPLYFKDDDSRLSFLFGNYITLTNLTEHEVSRMIHMRISPVRVSVHAMNPELRCRMMGNRFAGQALSLLRRFSDAGLHLECQLVLCPGMNDGDELDRSMEELAALSGVRSVAAVPVGLTAHREGLTTLRGFTPEESMRAVTQMEAFGQRMLTERGIRIFYPADEFYIKAGLSIPDADFYGDFPQLENGVGMWALMRSEFNEALSHGTAEAGDKPVILVTGTAAAPLMDQLSSAAAEKWKQLRISVLAVENDFFGHSIDVAGLITGSDLVRALTAYGGESHKAAALIPRTMLRHEGDLFLDGMRLEDAARQAGMALYPVDCSGGALVDAIVRVSCL